MSKLFERLEELKIERGLTNQIIAQNTHTTETSIARFIKGTRAPIYETFIHLLYYFDCSADYLLGLDEIPPNEPLREVLPFDERLRTVLQERGVSQAQLHRTIGGSTSAIFKWLNGISLPSTDRLIAIAKCLDCSVDYLIGRRR